MKTNTVNERFPVYDCIPEWIEWLMQAREEKDLSEKIKAGINYSLILGVACYIEGYLEAYLFRSVSHDKHAVSSLYERLCEELYTRISRTTGSDNYNNLFEVVIGSKITTLLNDPSLWDTIKNLFHFRNVIAHGRSVNYKLIFPVGVGGIWDEEFSGGYKKVEDFLTKKGFLTERHIEEADNYLYFKNEVADFYWKSAKMFISKLEANKTNAADAKSRAAD